MSKSERGFTAFVIALIGLLLVLFAMIAGHMKEFGASSLFQTYPGLIVAMASGFLGATFSMLLQSRNRASEGTLDDVSAASSWRTLTVRGSVGLGGAVILYFFFRSGLLDGNLWPDLNELGFDQLVEKVGENQIPFGLWVVPNEDWCLLIIWCFIAGFSETFVPNILVQTQARSTTTASP